MSFPTPTNTFDPATDDADLALVESPKVIGVPAEDDDIDYYHPKLVAGFNKRLVFIIDSEEKLLNARKMATHEKKPLITLFTLYNDRSPFDFVVAEQIRTIMEDERVGIKEGGVHFCQVDASTTLGKLDELRDPSGNPRIYPCIATYPFNEHETLKNFLTDHWSLSNKQALVNYITEQALQGARNRAAERAELQRADAAFYCVTEN